MNEIISLFSSIEIDSATLKYKLTNEKYMEELNKLLQQIYDDSINKKNPKNKSNRKLYWSYTFEEKHILFKNIKPIWNKINQEDYRETGPIKVIRKEYTKTDELENKLPNEEKKVEIIPKKKEQITEEEKIELKKNEKQENNKMEIQKYKDDEKMKEKNEDNKLQEEREEINNEKHLSLLSQINILYKIVNDLKHKINEKSKLRNIYINKPNPLKNWNLNLKNSFEIQGKYVKSICLNYETDTVIFGTKAGIILTYNIHSWDLIHNLSVHKGTVKDIVYLNDSRTIISVGNDGKIFKIDLETNTIIEFSITLPGPIRSIVYMRDGINIYTACQMSLYSFDIITGLQIQNKTNYDSEIMNIILIKAKNYIAIGFRNGMVRVFDPTSKNIVSEFIGHQMKVTSLSELRINGLFGVSSSSKDKTINIYSIEENMLKKTLKVAASRTNNFASKLLYGCDDKTLITTHEDGKIILNNFNTGDLEKEQTNKYLCSSADEKISSCFYCEYGINLIVGFQTGKIEVYATK